MRGGYILINCKELDLTGGDTPQTIPGIFADADRALKSGKLIIAENCVFGSGVPVNPVPVFGWRVSAGEIVIVGATLHVHIKSDDTLTVLDVGA